ncbi:MAG: hypothetical protein WDO15_24720 [Bacteroidota bacterium]
MITPLQTFLSNIPAQDLANYGSIGVTEYTTYVQLQDDARVSDVESMMTNVVDRQSGEILRRINTIVNVQLQPMKSLYFGPIDQPWTDRLRLCC